MVLMIIKMMRRRKKRRRMRGMVTIMVMKFKHVKRKSYFLELLRTSNVVFIKRPFMNTKGSELFTQYYHDSEFVYYYKDQVVLD